MGRTSSEISAAVRAVSFRHSLRALAAPQVARVDPILFGRCFEGWIKDLWPDRHDLIAIDGKTSRRTHDKRKGLKALHTLSERAPSTAITAAMAEDSTPPIYLGISAINVIRLHWGHV